MIVYTAEDFAGAVLATRDTDGVARRMAQESDKPWRASWIPDYDWLSDEEMAAGGWTPVVGSRVTEHTLRDSQEKAARKRERLVDHIADQDRVIRRRNDEIAVLRERVRVAESGRLSLDRLEAAWETAETIDSTGIGEGDLCIERCAERHFEVFRAEIDAEVDGVSRSTIRILSRAPKPREPWQELADVIREYTYESDPKWLAQALYQSGVRVTGGDDDE